MVFALAGDSTMTRAFLLKVQPSTDKAKALEAFAGFERGVYAGLDAGSGQRAA